MPDDMAMKRAHVAGIPGLTAAHAVVGGSDVAGMTLLISGGGIGWAQCHSTGQWAGATVIATDHPMPLLDHLAGADHVLDYRAADLADKILAC